jgi:flagellar biosynthesis/type III secretory pathway M-ring protein FliF/YscJ
MRAFDIKTEDAEADSTLKEHLGVNIPGMTSVAGGLSSSGAGGGGMNFGFVSGENTQGAEPNISDVRSTTNAAYLKKINEFIQQSPQEAIQVLRRWLNEDKA